MPSLVNQTTFFGVTFMRLCHTADGPPPQLVSPGPFVAIFVAVDGPPRPSMAATDGLLCHKWSPSFFSPARHKWHRL